MSIRMLIVTFVALGASIARAEPPPPSATEPAAPPPVVPAPASEPAVAPVPPAAASPEPPSPAAPASSSIPPPYVTPGAQPPLRANVAVPDAAVQVRLPVRPYAAPPPEPRRHGNAGAPFALGIGPGFVWRGESGHDVFTSRAYTPGLELFASYDVWTPLPRTVVAAGVGLRSEMLGDDDDFAVWHHAVQAELTTRFGATRWLWPQVRLALGAVTTRFRLTELTRDDLAYSDRDTHLTGQVGAGIELRTPSRTFETHRGRLSSLSLGVLVDGGYTFAKSASLAAEPDAGADIARTSFELGSLRRSGAYFRTLAVIRF